VVFDDFFEHGELRLERFIAAFAPANLRDEIVHAAVLFGGFKHALFIFGLTGATECRIENRRFHFCMHGERIANLHCGRTTHGRRIDRANGLANQPRNGTRAFHEKLVRRRFGLERMGVTDGCGHLR